MAKKDKKQGVDKAAAIERRLGKLTKRPAKGKKAPMSKAAAASQGNLWDRSTQFLREVVQELKRVVWPTRKQTLSTTGIVIALVVLVAVFLGMVDFVLSRLIRLLIS
jgi:preprotein translocase subunit SecE